jgi:hypothetical protein
MCHSWWWWCEAFSSSWSLLPAPAADLAMPEGGFGLFVSPITHSRTRGLIKWDGRPKHWEGGCAGRQVACLWYAVPPPAVFGCWIKKEGRRIS